MYNGLHLNLFTTNARKYENTKNLIKFRALALSCFRD